MSFVLFLVILALPLLAILSGYLVFSLRWIGTDRAKASRLPTELKKQRITGKHFSTIVAFFLAIIFGLEVQDGFGSKDAVLAILMVIALICFKLIHDSFLNTWETYLGDYGDIYTWLSGPIEEAENYKLRISKWMKSLRIYNLTHSLILESEDYDSFEARASEHLNDPVLKRFHDEFFKLTTEEKTTKWNLFARIQSVNQKIKSKERGYEGLEVFPYTNPKDVYADFKKRAENKSEFMERILYWFIVKLRYKDLPRVAVFYNPLVYFLLTPVGAGIFYILARDSAEITESATFVFASGLFFTMVMLTVTLSVFAAISMFSQKGTAIQISNKLVPFRDPLIVTIRTWSLLSSGIAGLTLFSVSVLFFILTGPLNFDRKVEPVISYTTVIASLTTLGIFMFHLYSAKILIKNSKELVLEELEKKIRELPDSDIRQLPLQQLYSTYSVLNDWPVDVVTLTKVVTISVIPQLVNLYYSGLLIF